MKRICITSIWMITGYFLFGQKDSTEQLTAAKDSIYSLSPGEVRAVRANDHAPVTKTNISKKEIASQNLGQDLPFLLNQTPSVVINSDAGNGVGYTYIHIRGTDASRINVTLNGIPYNDAESQGTFFVDLPDIASSINNIQIQRGVGTSTNGAGAFGATINFSTNEINRQQYVELNISYSSFYTLEKTYQAWYGVSEADLPIHRTINYAGDEQPGSPYPNETDNYWQNHYQLFFTQKILPELTFNTGLFYTKGYGYYEEYRANQDYADYHMVY